ncbi:hypothetical protein MHO82_13345 [Vibrio sp. Of7-15]|uniref:hypothetical protein n=1 Tax=Vibrio sp. Of7-15 TaxID=2724879 RepID=UPI001EF17023|nr:hypothetical protein [Vibrio sp. Of7-15]MCG7497849.1 hypothetical protein [Vibrio sp. Of7-15]
MNSGKTLLLTSLISGVLAGCHSNKTLSTTESHTEPRSLSVAFPQYTDVFGISIRATPTTPPESIKHAANIMAQYLDNNEDGTPDNPHVVNKMVEQGATLLIGTTDADFDAAADKLDSQSGTYQDLKVYEMHPNGAKSGQFDATLEEVLHLITHVGYANTYPDVFGEQAHSEIANAMDIARGGYFATIPSSYPQNAWYRYDDETCEYDCMVTEYTYWALTSILGAQDFSGRLEEIQHEWQLNNKQKVANQDPAVYRILTNPTYLLPTVLPDGNYQAIDFKISKTTSDPK